MTPQELLRHHVTGAIERGEADAIVEQPTARVGQDYWYHTDSGDRIPVFITKDCGIVQGQHAPWHKVLCKPIGFNNCPTMVLDFSTLSPR